MYGRDEAKVEPPRINSNFLMSIFDFASFKQESFLGSLALFLSLVEMKNYLNKLYIVYNYIRELK